MTNVPKMRFKGFTDVWTGCLFGVLMFDSFH